MPYTAGKDSRCPAGKPYGVRKKDGGKLIGCHPSLTKAGKQIAALNASESEGLRSGRSPS